MTKPDRPDPADHSEGLFLAALLLQNRLQDLSGYLSEGDALKLGLATSTAHWSPEVRDLLGRATCDLMNSAESVAGCVADAVLGREPEHAAED